jgi:hypothetical protein
VKLVRRHIACATRARAMARLDVLARAARHRAQELAGEGLLDLHAGRSEARAA